MNIYVYNQQSEELAMRREFAAKSTYPAHNVINMPALSPTMTAGNIGQWAKKVGDQIAPGDVLVEIETDKAAMDFECQEEGYLAKVLRDSGSKDVAVGVPIAVMVDSKDDVAAFVDFEPEHASSPSSSGGESASDAEGDDHANDSK